MSETETLGADDQSDLTSPRDNWLQWIAVAGLVYLLISAVGLIGSGFKSATGDQAAQLFEFATNPFAAWWLAPLPRP